MIADRRDDLTDAGMLYRAMLITPLQYIPIAGFRRWHIASRPVHQRNQAFVQYCVHRSGIDAIDFTDSVAQATFEIREDVREVRRCDDQGPVLVIAEALIAFVMLAGMALTNAEQAV